MEMAIGLAVKGEGFTSPNPMVGAVVVKDGVVKGKGYHKAVGCAHAEVNAINDAGTAAKGSCLYVTLEPCNHIGRTPPCTEKILEAGIKRVVIAMKDPNPEVRGGGIDYLKKHDIDVFVGVCKEKAEKLNECFIKYVKTKRPFTVLKCAATLDGQIATRTGDSKWVTGKESRKFVHRLRHALDGIMVGINTVKKDNPSLTCRLNDFDVKDPVRLILDTNLSVDDKANVLQLDSASDTIIICGKSVSEVKKAALERKGAKVFKSPLKNGMIDLEMLMDRLGSIGITSILIEGGSTVSASALSAGIVDKILFFYAPKIFGGNDGVPICKGHGPALINDCIPVKNIDVLRFGEDIVIEGYL